MRFDPASGLIIVPTQVHGPWGWRSLRLALDTGATGTTVRTATLYVLGLDPGTSPDRVEMTTASGVEYVPVVRAPRIVALGRERSDFLVVAHTLPPSSSVDGVLGLDFFRGLEVRIDFRRGLVSLG